VPGLALWTCRQADACGICRERYSTLASALLSSKAHWTVSLEDRLRQDLFLQRPGIGNSNPNRGGDKNLTKLGGLAQCRIQLREGKQQQQGTHRNLLGPAPGGQQQQQRGPNGTGILLRICKLDVTPLNIFHSSIPSNSAGGNDTIQQGRIRHQSYTQYCHKDPRNAPCVSKAREIHFREGDRCPI